MNMDFDIPDITENAGKAAIGGKHRKPRRAGKIRLGDSLRSISKEYTATREKKDEDKHIEFYSLSEGEEKFSFYGKKYPSSACASVIRKPPLFTWNCRRGKEMISSKPSPNRKEREKTRQA